MRLFVAAGITLVSMTLLGMMGAAQAAMTNDMDLVYGKYQMAIRAAQLCRDAPNTDAAWRKWSSYIDKKTNYELGAGERLSILEGVKGDVTYMVRHQGCDSDFVKELLQLYDSELAALVTE